jgi:hypothetical protein
MRMAPEKIEEALRLATDEQITSENARRNALKRKTFGAGKGWPKGKPRKPKAE